MAVSRRSFVTGLAILGAVACSSFQVAAQGYPDRPIRLVVPFAAGGNADINGRIVGDIIHRALGQPVVVENRAGAGGGVGAEFVARSAPDGYTMFIGSNGPLTVNPFVNPNLSYKPLEDFIAVSMISWTPHVPVVTNKLNVKSLAELIALSKTRPINLATSGVGSATHMTIERFKLATGAGITHVPYKSGGALLPDVISGNIDGAMTELATSLELHKGNQARIVGVAAATRTKLAPEIPTLDEQGVKDFRAQSFVGLMVPAKTPADIVEKLRAAVAAGLAPGGAAAGKLTGTGSEVASPEQMTSAGFAALIKRDYEDMRAAAKLAGLGPK